MTDESAMTDDGDGPRGPGKSRPLGMASATILLAVQRGTRYGFDIIERTGLPSGTVYPTLGRLEERGYLEAEWEDRETADEEGRPRRRYYRLTPAGEAELARALERVALISGLAGAVEPGSGEGSA